MRGHHQNNGLAAPRNDIWVVVLHDASKGTSFKLRVGQVKRPAKNGCWMRSGLIRAAARMLPGFYTRVADLCHYSSFELTFADAIAFRSRSSERSIQDAIAAAAGLPSGSFGLVTMDGSEAVPMDAALLQPGGEYEVRRIQRQQPTRMGGGGSNSNNHDLPLPLPPLAPAPAPDAEKRVAQGAGGTTDDSRAHGSAVVMEGVVDRGVVLVGRPATLPRVIIACLGTGRYRELAIGALQSARDKFGGDCRLSLHLLTDDIKGVGAEFNPAFVRLRTLSPRPPHPTDILIRCPPPLEQNHGNMPNTVPVF